jgi:hypothetical protein
MNYGNGALQSESGRIAGNKHIFQLAVVTERSLDLFTRGLAIQPAHVDLAVQATTAVSRHYPYCFLLLFKLCLNTEQKNLKQNELV